MFPEVDRTAISQERHHIVTLQAIAARRYELFYSIEISTYEPILTIDQIQSRQE